MLLTDISLSLLIPFAITCMIIELTPGPNMGYLAIISITVGRRAGYATTAGIALGLLVVGIAAALGLAALITNFTLLYQILRWGGVCYLLWLAWEGWHGEEENSPANTKNNDQIGKYFLRGLITNLLNPKAGLFYVAILPGFVNSVHPIIPQTVFLAIVYVLIATIIHLSIVTLAGTTRRFLNNPERSEIVRRILSTALAVIALWFAWSTRV